MKILFLDAYYEPEIIAYTHLERDLIEELILKGHMVHIICPVPTRGVSKDVRKQYQKNRHELNYNGKVIVERFYAPKEGKNPLLRAFRYLWCNLRTYQKAIGLENIDVVFSNSTPPTQGVLGGMVAKKLSRRYGKNIRFIYNLQDIFPDSLANTGLTCNGSLLWRIGREIEDFTYQRADKIIVISNGFKANILEKGVPEEKIEVISNWIDLDSVHPVKRKENKLFTEFGIDPSKFIVVYAGNFGASQGADIILKVAKELKEYKNIQFVIFGGGPLFEDAKKNAVNLENVLISNLLPQERISEVYSLGNVALITCKKGTGKAGLPSKTWSIMACNTPIVASFDVNSDLATTISDSNAGICVNPEDVSALKDALLCFYNEKERCETNNCLRNYVAENASREKCVDKFVKCIIS